MSDIAKNTVRVNIIGDASSLKKSMGEAGKATETAGKKMSDFAKVAVAALAVKALGAVKDFVADSHAAFVDLNESLNALEVTYGDAADGIKKLGEEAAGNLGLSNAEFNTFAVSLSAFAQQIAGDSGDVVGTVDELTTRVSDFASVMNLEVADAAVKFQSGLAGESEPLRKFGIDVSAARVETQALKDGIWDGVEAMTEAEKVQGRYNAIMEQTENTAGDFANTIDDFANSQRVANAEMENAKAALGESVNSAFQAATPLISAAAEALTVFSITALELQGNIDHTEASIRKFSAQTGATADTAAAALTIVKEYGAGFDELIPRLGMSTEELIKLRDADQDYLKSLGFTEEQIKAMTDAVDKEIAAQEILKNAVEDAGSAHQGARRHVVDLTAATEEGTDATEEATSALETFRDLIDNTYNPLVKLHDATVAAAEAQKAITTAVEEYGQGSPEHLAAIRDAADANIDLAEAEANVADNSRLTRDEFVKQQTELGLTREQAELLADELANLFKFDGKTVKMNVRVTKQGTAGTGGFTERAHGGPVKKGTPYVVGEEGPELLVPDQNGTIIPNGSNVGSAAGGIYLTVYAGLGTNGNDVGEQIVEEIIRARRRGVDV